MKTASYNGSNLRLVQKGPGGEGAPGRYEPNGDDL